MDNQNYAVMGVHTLPAVYETIQQGDGSQTNTMAQPERTVVRVRMFVGTDAVDEDFVMPRIITIEEQVDSAVQTRISELNKGVVPADSTVIDGDGDQVKNQNVQTPVDIVPAVREEPSDV